MSTEPLGETPRVQALFTVPGPQISIQVLPTGIVVSDPERFLARCSVEILTELQRHITETARVAAQKLSEAHSGLA
ncbi:MAG: hypothetical protein KGI71_05690 [Patescibacteria group bacterium]|nr:hypothetical protein [Patescibacteria group bacterium]